MYTHPRARAGLYLWHRQETERGFRAFEVQPYTQCSEGAHGLMKVPTSPVKGLYVISFHCCMLWFCTAWISQQTGCLHVLIEHRANKDITRSPPSCWQCQLAKYVHNISSERMLLLVFPLHCFLCSLETGQILLLGSKCECVYWNT